MTNEKSIKPIVYVGLIANEKLLLANYKVAPNPAKSGWWIPAPELAFGEDPKQRAQQIAAEFGFAGATVQLKDVESFVLPGGWHLIYHFTAQVDADQMIAPDSVEKLKWVSSEALREMKDLAHGNWEVRTGLSYLVKNS